MKIKKLQKTGSVIMALILILAQFISISTVYANDLKDDYYEYIGDNTKIKQCFDDKIIKDKEKFTQVDTTYTKCTSDLKKEVKTKMEDCEKKQDAAETKCLNDWKAACDKNSSDYQSCSKAYYNSTFNGCMDKASADKDICDNNATTHEDVNKEACDEAKDESLYTHYDEALNACYNETPLISDAVAARKTTDEEFKKCFDEKEKAAKGQLDKAKTDSEACLLAANAEYKLQLDGCKAIYDEEKQKCEQTKSTECEEKYEPGTAERTACDKKFATDHPKCLQTAIANQDKCLDPYKDTLSTEKEKCYNAVHTEMKKIWGYIETACTGVAPDTKETVKEISGKPDVDTLLYKYTSDFTAQPTTTDYIASLPEDRSPGQIFSQIIFYMLILANVFTFVGLIVSGIMMVTSQGNDEELTKAKRIFTYTIIALIICATSLALVTGITKLQFFSP